MGCDCSLGKEGNQTESEDVIGEYEVGLGWRNGSLNRLISRLQGVEVNLSPRQLCIVLSSVHVRTPNFQDYTDPVTHLYSYLKDKAGFSQAKLVILAVLLGGGEISDATDILVQKYSLDAETVDVTALAADMCTLALVILPKYVRLELEKIHDDACVSKLVKYSEKLKQTRADMIRILRTAIARQESRVRREDLKERLKTASGLMTANRLRKRAVKQLKPKPLNSILKTSSASPLTPTPTRTVHFLDDLSDKTD